MPLLRPYNKIHLIKKFMRDGRPKSILDIGCGVYSPLHFANAFPRCTYVGVDLDPPHRTDLPADFQVVRADLRTSDLGFLADGSFDLVVLTHVLEHLADALNILQRVCVKLAPEGTIFLAYPSADSVHFPHRWGTLNFHDDPTHVRVIQTAEILAVLARNGIDMLEAARTRSVLGLLRMFPEVVLSPFFGGISGPMFWDLYGFEEHVVGKKHVFNARRPRE